MALRDDIRRPRYGADAFDAPKKRRSLSQLDRFGPFAEAAEEPLLAEERTAELRRLFRQLTRRERETLVLCRGLFGVRPRSFAEAAKRLHLTHQRVRQLAVAGFERLCRVASRAGADAIPTPSSRLTLDSLHPQELQINSEIVSTDFDGLPEFSPTTCTDRSGAQPDEDSQLNPTTPQLLHAIHQTDHARTAPLPVTFQPALAHRDARPPTGDGWLHEVLLDGLRVLAWLDQGQVRLRSGNGHDWTERFPEIAAAISRLPARTALLDGKVVATLPTGVSSLSALQISLQRHQVGVPVYQAFDLLHLEGFDLQEAPLEQRKALLGELFAGTQTPRCRCVEHVTGGFPEFFAHCRDLGLAGVVSKRRDGAYPSDGTSTWRKTVCLWQEPFVIGGHAGVQGEEGKRALLLGYHDQHGGLVPVGWTGKISNGMYALLEGKLKQFESPTCPFATVPQHENYHDVRWVYPRFVVQVSHAGWSAAGLLRQAVPQDLQVYGDPKFREVVRQPAMR